MSMKTAQRQLAKGIIRVLLSIYKKGFLKWNGVDQKVCPIERTNE